MSSGDSSPPVRPAPVPNIVPDGMRDLSEDDDDEEEEENSVSEEEDDDDEDSSWISWFCNLKGNEFFVEIDDDYLQDDFNLTGLSSQLPFPYYDYALDMILDSESPTDEVLTGEQQEMVESAAEMLYGLVHARFILTSRGMSAMLEKYRVADFGRCPRVICEGQETLPVGQSDVPRANTVKLYCPKCEDIYYPKSHRQGNLDGAYFGTSFPHLFYQTYPELLPAKSTQTYIPRIYGFKIHKPKEPENDGTNGHLQLTHNVEAAPTPR